MTERSINVTSILNNFKSLMEQDSERGSAHKINKKEDQNIYFRADLSQRQIKLLTLKKKQRRLAFNNRRNLFFSKIQML